MFLTYVYFVTVILIICSSFFFLLSYFYYCIPRFTAFFGRPRATLGDPGRPWAMFGPPPRRPIMAIFGPLAARLSKVLPKQSSAWAYPFHPSLRTHAEPNIYQKMKKWPKNVSPKRFWRVRFGRTENSNILQQRCRHKELGINTDNAKLAQMIATYSPSDPASGLL